MKKYIFLFSLILCSHLSLMAQKKAFPESTHNPKSSNKGEDKEYYVNGNIKQISKYKVFQKAGKSVTIREITQYDMDGHKTYYIKKKTMINNGRNHEVVLKEIYYEKKEKSNPPIPTPPAE